MPAVAVNGLNMHYDEAGCGPAVVLLHGFPMDRRIWAGQLEGLCDRYRVIAPDFRGAGQSRDASPFTIESLADDVHVLLQKIGAWPCVLGGLSMGGYVCFTYWRKYAAELKGLMLINTRPQADPQAVRENRTKTAEQALSQGAGPIVDAMLGRLFSPGSRRPELTARVRRILQDSSPLTIAHASLAMRDRPDSVPLLAGISVPALIIAGADDPIIPLEVPRQMHAAIGGSQLAIIPGAAHLTAMEQPQQVNRAMRGFLEALG